MGVSGIVRLKDVWNYPIVYHTLHDFIPVDVILDILTSNPKNNDEFYRILLSESPQHELASYDNVPYRTDYEIIVDVKKPGQILITGVKLSKEDIMSLLETAKESGAFKVLRIHPVKDEKGNIGYLFVFKLA